MYVLLCVYVQPLHSTEEGERETGVVDVEVEIIMWMMLFLEVACRLLLLGRIQCRDRQGWYSSG